MKPLYSEEYYRNNWEEMLATARGEHGINLEEEYQYKIEQYKEGLMDIPEALLNGINKEKFIEDFIEKASKKIAEEIIEKATKLVLREMEEVKAIEAGNATLGYTTQIQETRAREEFRKRFDFNCLQLADFKKKH